MLEDTIKQAMAARAKVRGFYAIGIDHPKHTVNTGTLWRSAQSMGARFIFTVGRRFRKQGSDTCSAWQSIPMLEFDSIEDLKKHLPYSCRLIAVENHMHALPLKDFRHPERACYILGAEDRGLSSEALAQCHGSVILPGSSCLNVAVAGSILMYDRVTRRGEATWAPRM